MSTQAAAGDRYKTLAANTALISFGTLGSKLMVFFMVRFYTGYMSPANYGTADIITQTANLLVPLVSFGMAEAVFRFAANHWFKLMCLALCACTLVYIGAGRIK